MNYLFIDASENSTFAQTGNNSGFIAKTFDTNRNFAAKITTICDQMLAEAGISQSQLDLLSVCTGPGSLTGLRVAAGFMRTMALLLQKPLTGVNLFEWSLQTLLANGYEGPLRLVMPTLIDKAFEVCATLPDLTHSQPVLIERSAIVSQTPTFGIRFIADKIQEVQPEPAALHKILLSASTKACDFNDILEILPMYVIPSQAERKFKETK